MELVRSRAVGAGGAAGARFPVSVGMGCMPLETGGYCSTNVLVCQIAHDAGKPFAGLVLRCFGWELREVYAFSGYGSHFAPSRVLPRQTRAGGMLRDP
jgi:hypothetical protein